MQSSMESSHGFRICLINLLVFCIYVLNSYYLPGTIVNTAFQNMVIKSIMLGFYVKGRSRRKLPRRYWETDLNKEEKECEHVSDESKSYSLD